jgi:hypothetical protein
MPTAFSHSSPSNFTPPNKDERLFFKKPLLPSKLQQDHFQPYLGSHLKSNTPTIKSDQKTLSKNITCIGIRIASNKIKRQLS